MARYWTGGHTKHKLQYHVVWMPKYRKRVLRGKIAYRLKGLLYDACRINRWWIGKINIQSDHVHLLIQLQAHDTVAEAVRVLKGGTSKIIRKEFPELEEFLWGDNFWAEGYFAESVGEVQETVIRKYIDEQSK
jgi:putative transposase